MLLSATFLPPKLDVELSKCVFIRVSVVVSIKNGKDKGHLSPQKTLPFPPPFPRGMFSMSTYHGAGLWLPVSKGWVLALQWCCSRLLPLGSWLSSCTQTQPDLCIVCDSSSRSLQKVHSGQAVFGFPFQSLKTTFMQCSLVIHACTSVELGHLLFLPYLVVVSFGQLWILPSCQSPCHESQNQKQHPPSWRKLLS